MGTPLPRLYRSAISCMDSQHLFTSQMHLLCCVVPHTSVHSILRTYDQLFVSFLSFLGPSAACEQNSLNLLSPCTPHTSVLLLHSHAHSPQDWSVTLSFTHRFPPTPPGFDGLCFLIRTLHYANQTSTTYNVLELGDDIPISVTTN
jgi:hypothetical protein